MRLWLPQNCWSDIRFAPQPAEWLSGGHDVLVDACLVPPLLSTIQRWVNDEHAGGNFAREEMSCGSLTLSIGWLSTLGRITLVSIDLSDCRS
jgi:hypothetical protein